MLWGQRQEWHKVWGSWKDFRKCLKCFQGQGSTFWMRQISLAKLQGCKKSNLLVLFSLPPNHLLNQWSLTSYAEGPVALWLKGTFWYPYWTQTKPNSPCLHVTALSFWPLSTSGLYLAQFPCKTQLARRSLISLCSASRTLLKLYPLFMMPISSHISKALPILEKPNSNPISFKKSSQILQCGIHLLLPLNHRRTSDVF